MEQSTIDKLICGAEWHLSEAVRVYEAKGNGIEWVKVAQRLLQKIPKPTAQRCGSCGDELPHEPGVDCT